MSFSCNRHGCRPSFLIGLLVALLMPKRGMPLNGGRSMIDSSDGWKAIEVISEGDRPEGSSWRLPGNLDGMGAFLVDSGNTLSILVNHELSKGAAISEIRLDTSLTMQAVANMIQSNTVGGVEFVKSSDLAYDKWTRNNGESWRTTVDPNISNFCRFFSSQSYEANLFGENRGFVDRVYITGEECEGGRLFALKAGSRDLFQVSGITGHVKNGSGIGGMPFDSFENAALIDTGETKHVALMLSSDGGAKTFKLYVGKKGVDEYGEPDKHDNFLARNGLLYGEWYYLGSSLSTGCDTWAGGFVTDRSDAFRAEKFEDIDTNPSNPRQVELAESNSGVYFFDFDLAFDSQGGNGFFDTEQSRFTAKLISDDFFRRSSRYPNKVDWTRKNPIFDNKDNDEGGIGYMKVNGQENRRVGSSRVNSESNGILDISHLLNYPPSMVMITTNQGEPSSMTLLLNPDLGDLLLPPVIEEKEERPQGESDCPATSNLESQVIQAEDADMLIDASILEKESGFCGHGYVDFGDASNAGIEFKLDIVSAGTYHVSVRYANGGAAGKFRPGSFQVDNVDQMNDFVFATTKSWSAWTTETKSVVFNDEGRHTLEIWWSSDELRPNIDWISVKLVDDAGRI